MVPMTRPGGRKGALGPGADDGRRYGRGRCSTTTEIKDKLAAAQPFGDWVGKINELDRI